MTGDDARPGDPDTGDLTAAEAARLAEIASLLADSAVWAESSPAGGDLLVAAIGAERGLLVDRSAHGGGLVAGAAGGVRAGQAGARRRRWSAIAGAAMAGAAAAAVITALVMRDGSTTEAARERVQLTGAPGSPTAKFVGSAELSSEASGVRIELAVPGLPRREGGDFYQLWLKNCDGTELVPAGSFHELDHATGWAGVALSGYPLLTVTAESVAGPDDPHQGSSGDVVLAGASAACG